MEREQTTLRLPPALKEELAREAQGLGISLNDYLLSIIHDRKVIR
ncbi:MAG: type II toxin-antitoxin system HicB family antitoxin [Puniceicoccales bacterium]|nr:type II toxin-antitoxin system HicB family antitoxin [Puniceicoccales bacterium]